MSKKKSKNNLKDEKDETPIILKPDGKYSIEEEEAILRVSRPPTPYKLFLEDKMEKITKTGKEKKSELKAKLSEEWKAMKDSQKKDYTKRSAEKRKKFKEIYPNSDQIFKAQKEIKQRRKSFVSRGTKRKISKGSAEPTPKKRKKSQANSPSAESDEEVPEPESPNPDQNNPEPSQLDEEEPSELNLGEFEEAKSQQSGDYNFKRRTRRYPETEVDIFPETAPLYDKLTYLNNKLNNLAAMCFTGSFAFSIAAANQPENNSQAIINTQADSENHSVSNITKIVDEAMSSED